MFPNEDPIGIASRTSTDAIMRWRIILWRSNLHHLATFLGKNGYSNHKGSIRHGAAEEPVFHSETYK